MSQRGRIWAAMAKIKAGRESQARAEAGGDQQNQEPPPRVSRPIPTISSQPPVKPETPAPQSVLVSEVIPPAEPPRSARGRAMNILRRATPATAPSQPVPEQQASSSAPRSPPPQSIPLTALQKLRLQQQQPSPAQILANLPSDVPKLTRQGSDVSSKASLLSQHFASVDSDDNYKAKLSKEPSNIGQEITLSLNYMTFNVDPDQSIEEYHVDFSPGIESIRLRYHLLRSEAAQKLIGSVLHWTGTNLYLPTKLEQRATSFQSLHPVTNQPVEVRLMHVKTPPDCELLPFYNSLMHKVMNKLRYVVINRQHYSPVHKISIQAHNLEVWPGWITTIQRLDGGLKLSVDASFRMLRLETVRDLMRTIKNNSNGMNLVEAFNQQLVGSIVMTRYNNKAYRIDEITTAATPASTFNMDKENRSISYADYMREHWNVQVNDLSQPMIIHRPKPKRGEEKCNEVFLIPELCVTTGLTDEMRSNFNIMKAIHEHTRLAPNVRESKLTEFLQQLATDERAKSVLSDWNLSVKPTLDVVKGRRLDPETVHFGEGKSFRVPEKADWTRPATSFPVFKNVDIENWVIMFTERDSPIAEDFMGNLREVSRALNIRFKAPRIIRLPNDSAMTYVNYGKREVKTTDQLVVLLTPGRAQREDRYSACKRLYSCEIPVPCQFIRCGTISNPQKVRAICQKIVLQILCKVGGQPWAMKFPMKSFMIIGVDVYHDTIDRKKSCVGFVASMNEFTSHWWSQTFFQNSLEEINQKLSQTVMNAIKKYHQINGFVPERIIIYRDGVGDGQMETVVKVEVVQLMNGIKFYMRDCHAGEPEPQISYVLVQKRINAKIALRHGNNIVNPPPGSFVDHTITHPEYNDFYLVSQHVNQGTVSPTKYVVLTETGTLKRMHHQRLAYKMTHMYYNWCGTVRVPAPCQYAHKLAYLCGQNIKQSVNSHLDEKLFYL